MRSADDSDFTEFVSGSSRRLLGLAYLLTWDRAAADRLVRRALGRVYRSWPRLRREGAPEAYARKLLVSGVVEGPGGQLAPSVESADRHGSLLRAVFALPVQERAALVLRYFEGLSEPHASPAGADRDVVMSATLEPELIAAFDSLGSSMSPPPDLADQVRRQVRGQRRRQRLVAAVAVVLVAGVGVVAVGRGTAKPPQKDTRSSFRVSAFNVESMAIGGNTLYVAMNAYPRGLLTAYDTTTGSEGRSARLPAGPDSVVVAPDGTVWVAFYPSNASRHAGVAEFSPDLSQRSVLLTDDRYLRTATFDVEPLGHGQALLATNRGLVTASLPPLGAAQTVHANPANAVLARTGQGFGPATKLAGLSDGNVAALLSAASGRSRVILQHGTAEFAGTQMTLASSPEGLWVTTGVGPDSRLQRLSDSLAPLPIGAVVHAVSVPGGTDRVWTNDRTVWVATRGHRITLTCFVFSGPTDGRSATVALPPADSAEVIDPIVSGDVTIAPSQQALYVASPFGIRSYPVPTSCRS